MTVDRVAVTLSQHLGAHGLWVDRRGISGQSQGARGVGTPCALLQRGCFPG